jgi:hypothetical protein
VLIVCRGLDIFSFLNGSVATNVGVFSESIRRFWITEGVGDDGKETLSIGDMGLSCWNMDWPSLVSKIFIKNPSTSSV